MLDFNIFYKEVFFESDLNRLPKYDLYISAFDNCQRTTKIYDHINAGEKWWLIFPHYTKIRPEDYPEGEKYISSEFKEDDYFLTFFSKSLIDKSKNICIDITGFIRPHLIYLLKYISILGIKKVDLLYTEPQHYIHSDETTFSGFIDEIRPIEACGSIDINSNIDRDILIICAGYDDALIAKIAQQKNYCKKTYCILGFPSLQLDMYQEGILKLQNAAESIGNIIKEYAPAFDPFATAQILNDIIEENPDATNIYLSPLSTKPQTIGMALYYIWFFDKKPISIIFPFSKHYSSKNAVGINRTWKYTFEFPGK